MRRRFFSFTFAFAFPTNFLSYLRNPLAHPGLQGTLFSFLFSLFSFLFSAGFTLLYWMHALITLSRLVHQGLRNRSMEWQDYSTVYTLQMIREKGIYLESPH